MGFPSIAFETLERPPGIRPGVRRAWSRTGSRLRRHRRPGEL